MTTSEDYRASYDWLIEYENKNGDFFDRFYRNFMGMSEEIRQKFEKINVGHQTALLKNFMVHLQSYFDHDMSPSDYFADIAHKHGRHGIKIPPEMYQQWLEAFLKTLEECDPNYDESVAAAWRSVLEPGIEFICENY